MNKRIAISLPEKIAEQLDQICGTEHRRPAETARLLLLAGLRMYRRKGSLLCGFPTCTREGCCGGKPGVRNFRVIKGLSEE